MKRLVAFSSVLVVALLLLFASPAFADEAAARVHFKKGIELYDKKQFQDALEEFEAAYREKPSAGIKQNVALCLKGLNRPAEAATAFDEALDEGKDTLKPETKQAIERELAELSKVVATLNVTVADEKKSAESVITIQPATGPGQALAPGAHRKPIRLMPGIYTLSAKIPGRPPPEPKRLALITGPPTEVTFGSGAPTESSLDVHTSVPDAVIKIDGVEVAKGRWRGLVTPDKKVHVEVSAPGYRTHQVDLVVPANSAVDSPITLQPVGSAPGEYRVPGSSAAEPPKPARRMYVAFDLSLEGSSYRLSQAVGATRPGGVRETYPGISIAGRFGFLGLKSVAIEGIMEAGISGRNEENAAGATGSELKTQITHWLMMPAFRFQTSGRTRFMAAVGAGVQGLQLESQPQGVSAKAPAPVGTNVNSLKASGIGAAFLLEAGAQFDVSRIFLEVAVFANIHGVGPVEEKVTGARALLDSPGVRGGLRFGIGLPF